MEHKPLMIAWNFEPYHKVRTNVIEEVVFTKRWRKLMLPERICLEQEPFGEAGIKVDEWFILNESPSFPILQVLGDFRVPQEHDTRIASNMIRWLGTNEGSAFLGDAADFVKKGIEPELAHLTVWCKMNIRNRMCNYGAVPRDSLTSNFNEVRVAASVRDVETLDQVAKWLGGEDGQAFVAGCQRNIALKWERKYEARRAATRAKMEARIDPK